MRTIFVLLAASAMEACQPRTSDQTEQANAGLPFSVRLTEQQQQEADIQTGTLEVQKMATPLYINGKIEVPPQNLVSITVPLGGYLRSTPLLPGTTVRRGELLAVLEDPQYVQLQQNYLTARIKAQTSEAEYRRQSELNREQASSNKVLQQAFTDFESDRILVKALEEQLRLLQIDPLKLTPESLSRTIEIRAPFTGFVTRVNGNVGKYVAPADVLFELVDPSDIHLTLRVFEGDLHHLRVGQTLMASPSQRGAPAYTCVIIRVSQYIEDDRTAEVHCHFRKYDPALVPGMLMRAEVEAEAKEVWVLPEDAWVSYSGKWYVFVAVGDREYEMKEVLRGTESRGFVELRDGSELKNSRIVIRGAYGLLMALRNSAQED